MDVEGVGAEKRERRSPLQFAHDALAQSQATARGRGYRPGASSVGARGGRKRMSFSRDPETVGGVLNALLEDKGWAHTVSVHGVIERWREVVGDDIADHCEPVNFTDGVLLISASSSVWARSLAQLEPTLLRTFDEIIGVGIVTKIRTTGPRAPNWKHGRYTVPGRGPRDTYG